MKTTATRVEEIQEAIKRLSLDDMKRVQELVENLIEDQQEFTARFRAKIERSKQSMQEGKRPRAD